MPVVPRELPVVIVNGVSSAHHPCVLAAEFSPDHIVEYVGLEEFVAFAAAKAGSIGVLSCVVQRNDSAGSVSLPEYAASSSDIDPVTLGSAMSKAGYVAVAHGEDPLPNGKVGQDFRPDPGRVRRYRPSGSSG